MTYTEKAGLSIDSALYDFLVKEALPGTGVLERAINPALALMLYVTFLQVPVAELRRAFGQVRFLAALMTAGGFVASVVGSAVFAAFTVALKNESLSGMAKGILAYWVFLMSQMVLTLLSFVKKQEKWEPNGKLLWSLQAVLLRILDMAHSLKKKAIR